MNLRIQWQKGGHADLVSLAEQAIVLRSSISSPPGSRLDATLPSGAPLQVKVHGCKREGETFVLSGRIFNASRAVVAELTASS